MTRDIIIAGGGLAGLTLAYFLAEAGKGVLVIESKNYPRNRVCGEYLSLESLPVLERMGIALPEDSPWISFLKVFAGTSENPAKGHLPLGAIGLSRNFLDHALYQACLRVGVQFMLNTRVISVVREGDKFIIKTPHEVFQSQKFRNATGKAPSLENQPQLGRPKYLAVKFRVEDLLHDDSISLYQFPGGYCGTSLVEGHQRCICYLARQELLDQHKTIEMLERYIVSAIPTSFQGLIKNRQNQVVISNFYFGASKVANSLGDSNYLVPPLTGNGMSLAIRDGYREAKELTGTLIRKFKPNPASLYIQAASELKAFKSFLPAMRAKAALSRVVESTFGPII